MRQVTLRRRQELGALLPLGRTLPGRVHVHRIPSCADRIAVLRSPLTCPGPGAGSRFPLAGLFAGPSAGPFAGPTSSSSANFRSFPRARESRERTVPTGIPRTSAAAVYSRPSHRQSVRTSRSGLRSAASAVSAAASRRRSSSRPATSSAWSGTAVSARAAATAAARYRRLLLVWLRATLVAMPSSHSRSDPLRDRPWRAAARPP